ncbi:unnamed protein product, partial [Mesorhabditis belari]|uniref:Regulatory protein SIR2 homolog 7 n=1 Tax=Mesorhabditis belari TaxID=2138241 RepID=A0AAF3FL79_9BILA
METKRSTRRKVEEKKRLKKEQKKKVKKLKKPSVDRKKEYEENNYSLEKKVRRLAKWMEDAETTLVYTGAGISTAANIPDYRGPNGVWTLASQGKEIIRCGNIMSTEPTTSHMILKELHRQRYITHILSQNCDGLHLRSGLPQTALSEIHGNMNIEVCSKCERQHIRAYDVTMKSALQKHGTGRFCDSCKNELEDTIVHFGECGRVRWPLNWDGTRRHLPKANLIICVGTSLAVLKAYGELWPEKDQETKVVIVNLQWTVKDKEADMKIHSKSDNFFEKLAYYLDIQPDPYCRSCDPVLNHIPIKEKFDKKKRNDIIRKISTCDCDGVKRIVDLPTMPTLDQEEASTSGEMPGWWAYGLKQQMSTGKKKGRVAKLKKHRKDSEQQIVQQVLKDLLDKLDPQRSPRTIPKGELKSDEATNSENSDKELDEVKMNGKRKRITSMKDRRVKTPELMSRLGIEAGVLLGDSSNDSDSDDDYTISKQQMGSDHRPGLRATRRSSNTQSTPSLLDGLPPRINKNRGQTRKRKSVKEEENEDDEITKKKSLMETFKKENSMEFTSTSVSTPSMDSQAEEVEVLNRRQGKGSPCSSISEEIGGLGEKSLIPETVIFSQKVEPKTEMTVREFISSQSSSIEPSLRREPNESLDDFLARTLPPEYYRQSERIETPRGDPNPLSTFDSPGVFAEMVQLAEEAFVLASRIKSDRPENSENQRPKPSITSPKKKSQCTSVIH